MPLFSPFCRPGNRSPSVLAIPLLQKTLTSFRSCTRLSDVSALCCAVSTRILCAVLCCAVLCCAVLRCAVLCCALLCCECVEVHLHVQTEKQRLIWAYKILFLDVLFPLNLRKVIFCDSDQVVRGNMAELWNMDLHVSIHPSSLPPSSSKSPKLLKTDGYKQMSHEPLLCKALTRKQHMHWPLQ